MTADPKLARIHADRQSKYGPWRDNMEGTSEQLQGLLRNWTASNPGRPLPPWWTPLMQVATKLNRIASGHYHDDNFDDSRVYLAFVEAMQSGREMEIAAPGNEPLRIYVAGPYSAPTLEQREANMNRAVEIAAMLMALGHDVFCPHAATHPIDVYAADEGLATAEWYERWMRFDFGIIRLWSNALYLIEPSPGSNREHELARSLGRRIFTALDQVPKCPAGTLAHG